MRLRGGARESASRSRTESSEPVRRKAPPPRDYRILKGKDDIMQEFGVKANNAADLFRSFYRHMDLPRSVSNIWRVMKRDPNVGMDKQISDSIAKKAKKFGKLDWSGKTYRDVFGKRTSGKTGKKGLLDLDDPETITTAMGGKLIGMGDPVGKRGGVSNHQAACCP